MTFDQLLGQVLGPLGALVGAVVTVVVLWREHVKADADDRAQRDKAIAIAETAVAGLARLADAWETRNRDDAQRRRLGDP